MTKKNIFTLIIIVISVVLVFTIFAVARTHTLTLDYNYYAGGLPYYVFPEPPASTTELVTVRHNLRYSPPTLNRVGYTFQGWYKDSALTVTWVNGEDRIKSDITLYAKWS